MEKKDVVLCLGLPRSGSTWIYNAALAILKSNLASGQISAEFCNDILLDKREPGRVRLIKSHMPAFHDVEVSGLNGVAILLSIRHPFDAVSSLMERFGLNFPDAAGAVYSSAQRILATANHFPHHCFRYESGFTGHSASVRTLGRTMGYRTSPQQEERILADLSPGAVQAKIAELTESGAFAAGAPMAVWDPETHWHPGHLGDGRIGKFEALLSKAEIDRLRLHFASFIQYFGYSDEIDG